MGRLPHLGNPASLPDKRTRSGSSGALNRGGLPSKEGPTSGRLKRRCSASCATDGCAKRWPTAAPRSDTGGSGRTVCACTACRQAAARTDRNTDAVAFNGSYLSAGPQRTTGTTSRWGAADEDRAIPYGWRTGGEGRTRHDDWRRPDDSPGDGALLDQVSPGEALLRLATWRFHCSQGRPPTLDSRSLATVARYTRGRPFVGCKTEVQRSDASFAPDCPIRERRAAVLARSIRFTFDGRSSRRG